MSAARFVGQIRMASRVLDVSDRPLVMGVLNVTPDSFSDGGDFFEPDAAVRQAERMIRQGADIIDVGGESTRPGSQPTPADEQIRRTVPVIERIRARDRQIVLSIDTRSAAVARAGLEAGADMVNDISALRDDPAMAELVARRGAAVVLMHMKGTPATMQNRPVYRDVVAEVCQFLQQRVAAAVAAGIRRQSIVIDPGIGFGKTTEHNLQLLGRLDVLAGLGQPVLVGPSRKRFIGQVLGIDEPKERQWGTAAAVAAAVLGGAHILRVHDVQPMRQVASLCWAIRRGTWP